MEKEILDEIEAAFSHFEEIAETVGLGRDKFGFFAELYDEHTGLVRATQRFSVVFE